MNNPLYNSLYRYITPLNAVNEKEKFFSSDRYNPKYEYPKENNNLLTFQKTLNSYIPSGPFKELLEDLKREQLAFIELIKNSDNSSVFTAISGKLFGFPEKEDKAIADSAFKKNISDKEYRETVSSESIKIAMEKEILSLGIEDWKVMLSNKILSKINISTEKKKILVNKNYSFFPEEAKRLKIHEIQIHLIRHMNGTQQKEIIFARGLASYTETEEGLAVFAEEITGNLNEKQLKIYSGRLQAADLARISSFRETFTELSKSFPEEIAYRLTERAKRGLIDTGKPGAFTKDICYITGYRKIKEYDKKHNLKNMFIGKTSIQRAGYIESMLKKGYLVKPKYLPDFLND